MIKLSQLTFLMNAESFNKRDLLKLHKTGKLWLITLSVIPLSSCCCNLFVNYRKYRKHQKYRSNRMHFKTSKGMDKKTRVKFDLTVFWIVNSQWNQMCLLISMLYVEIRFKLKKLWDLQVFHILQKKEICLLIAK